MPNNFLQRIKVLGKFASVQVIVQIVGLGSGLFLVRCLDKQQYAYFTMANTMQMTMGVLADCGVSIGLTSIGGKVWQDRYRFGRLIATALQLRAVLAAITIFFTAPILLWMLYNNGASLPYAFWILACVLLALNSQLTTSILDVVPRLHSQVTRLQNLDLVTALSRVAILAVTFVVFLKLHLFFNAGITVLIGSLALLLKNRLLRHWVVQDVDMHAPPLEEDRIAFIKIIKQQAGNAIFYTLQGQVTVWLISFFGSTQSIAEVGALGRLTMIFSVTSALMFNIVGPAFSRCQSRAGLLRIYWQVIGCYAIFCGLLLLITVLFPDQMLWVLGSKYSHLRRELLLIILGGIPNALLGGVWGMNAARGWVKYIWLYPPLTIAMQIVLLFFLNVGTTRGALIFGAFSGVPNLCVNFFVSYIGFRDEKKLAMAA